MTRVLIALFAVLLLSLGFSAPAAAQNADSVLTSIYDAPRTSIRIGDQEPFGDVLIAERTSVFSYQCFYDTSLLRDWITNSGTSSATTEDCVLMASVGSGGDGTYRYESVDFGIYQAGKGAEMGIGLRMRNEPTGDSYYRVGMDDGDDGAFFEFDADGISFVVEKNGVRQADFARDDWNRDRLDGTGRSGVSANFYDQSYIFGMRWSWYGVGKICGYVWAVGSERTAAQMEGIAVHCFAPAGDFPSIANPNLPVFAEVSNGSDGSGQEMLMEVGGRRYDILGPFDPNTRKVSAFRGSVTASSNASLTPLICARREPDFPSSGEENTLTIDVNQFTIESEGLVQIGLYSVESITGTWVDPANAGSDNYADGESGTEFSIDVSDMTNPVLISELEFATGTGGQGNQTDPAVTPVQDRAAPIIRTRPTCLAVRSRSGSNQDVQSVMTVREFW
jgi:hypothetical protein